MEVDHIGPFVKMGSEYALRFEDGTDFEEVYQERAKNELGETPERRVQALEELKRLIRGNARVHVQYLYILLEAEIHIMHNKINLSEVMFHYQSIIIDVTSLFCH